MIQRDSIKRISFKSMYIILFVGSTSEDDDDNIIGFSENGDVLWQIEHSPRLWGKSPYMDMRLDDELVCANGWDGQAVWINPKDGHIVKKELWK